MDQSTHEQQSEMFQRLGHITRQLHDALNQLGYTPALKDAAQVDDLLASLGF